MRLEGEIKRLQRPSQERTGFLYVGHQSENS
jgi:hypothetical protein